MYFKKINRRIYRKRRSVYVKPEEEKPRLARRSGMYFALVFLAVFVLFIGSALVFLNDISSRIAVSDAADIVTVKVNETLSDIFRENDYSPDWFVAFEKNEAGEVCAVNCNMARINALSSEILSRTVNSTDNKTITVSIPAGNLTGISLLMGRGPSVPVKILMLTSSRVEFNNNVVSAGINQTGHRINLDIIVDVDILLPWGTESTQTMTEVMIADTVIVGNVPQTYLNLPIQE